MRRFRGLCADGPGSLRRYFNLPRQSLSIRRAAAPHPASWGRSLRTRRCAPQGKHGARCARGLRRILRPPSRLPSSAAPSARAAPMASPAPPPSDKRMSDRTRMSDRSSARGWARDGFMNCTNFGARDPYCTLLQVHRSGAHDPYCAHFRPLICIAPILAL